MINISIICWKIDTGLLTFIRNLSSSNKVIVSTIIVAPEVKLHPLRLKQISNRKKVLNALNLYPKQSMFQLMTLILDKIKIKKLILNSLLLLYRWKYKFTVEKVNTDWAFVDKRIYNDIAILYSFEGLLTEDVLLKFNKGIINIHPAILPEYRGLDGNLWALYENGILGVTAYQIDKGIDTGPIIKIFKLNNISKSFAEYLSDLKKLKYESYLEAILRFNANNFEDFDPKIYREQNRGVMPKKTIKKVIQAIEING